MTCRVIAEEKTCIPANSSAWVTVKPGQEHSKTKTAFVEPNESQPPVHLLPGVIETGVSEELRDLNIVNCSEEPVTVYPNTTLGMILHKSRLETQKLSWNSLHVMSLQNT